jgi:hypothetical protein
MVIVNHRQARHGDARAEPDSHPSSAGTRGYLASMRTNVSARGQPISARSPSLLASSPFSVISRETPLYSTSQIMAYRTAGLKTLRQRRAYKQG